MLSWAKEVNYAAVLRNVNFIRLMAFDWASANVTSLINPLSPPQSLLADDQQDNIVSQESSRIDLRCSV